MHLKMLSAEVSIETDSVDTDPVVASLSGSTLFDQEISKHFSSGQNQMTCRDNALRVKLH